MYAFVMFVAKIWNYKCIEKMIRHNLLLWMIKIVHIMIIGRKLQFTVFVNLHFIYHFVYFTPNNHDVDIMS